MLEPQNLYIKLPADVADALYRTAHRRWRRPKDQAVFLIAEGLRQLGELPSDPDAERHRVGVSRASQRIPLARIRGTSTTNSRTPSLPHHEVARRPRPTQELTHEEPDPRPLPDVTACQASSDERLAAPGTWTLGGMRSSLCRSSGTSSRLRRRLRPEQDDEGGAGDE